MRKLFPAADGWFAGVWFLLAIFLFSALFLSRVYKGTVTLYSLGDDDYYWAFPRSLVYDGDLSMRDEPLPTFKQFPEIANFASPFPGLLWTPAVIIGRLAAPLIERLPEASAADVAQGVSSYQRLLVGAFSGALTFAGLIFLYAALAWFVRRDAAFLACIAVLLGTPLFYFTFRRPMMSHSAELFSLAAFAICSLKFGASPSSRFLALVTGFTGALAVGVRYPNLFPVVGWSIMLVAILYKQDRPPLRSFAWFAFGALTVAAFQLFEWRAVRGTVVPTAGIYSMHPTDIFHMLRLNGQTLKSFVEIWAGPGWGLLWLESVVWLALVATLRKGARSPLLRILLLGLLPLFLVAANFGSQGESYAYRYVLAKVLWLVFGVAVFFDTVCGGARRKVLILSVCLFLPVTAGLLFESGPDALTLQPRDGGWRNNRFVVNAATTLVNDPKQLVLSLSGTPAGHLALVGVAHTVGLGRLPAAIREKATTRVAEVPLAGLLWYLGWLFVFSTGFAWLATRPSFFRESARAYSEHS